MKDVSQRCLHPLAATGTGGCISTGSRSKGSQDRGKQVLVDRFEREPLTTKLAASPNVAALAGSQAQTAPTTLVRPWRHADNYTLLDREINRIEDNSTPMMVGERETRRPKRASHSDRWRTLINVEGLATNSWGTLSWGSAVTGRKSEGIGQVGLLLASTLASSGAVPRSRGIWSAKPTAHRRAMPMCGIDPSASNRLNRIATKGQ
jgi:hypothetical protein